jgi:ribonuclease P protein component
LRTETRNSHIFHRFLHRCGKLWEETEFHSVCSSRFRGDRHRQKIRSADCSTLHRSLTGCSSAHRIVGSSGADFSLSLRIFDETYLSTESAAPSPDSRLPRAHGHQERTHCPQAPSRQRQETVIRIVINKLRRRAEFTRVYERGSRCRTRFMTCFALPNELGAPRLGIAASQKIGNAVVRNRAKRLVRELFRSHKLLTGIDIVVIPRREMIDASWSNLEADYRAALQRLERGGGNRVSPGKSRNV